MERVCERCAGDDDDLVLVRSPGPGDAATDGAGTELWCFDCRSSADHVAVEEG